MSGAEREDGREVRFVPPGEGRSLWVFGGLVTFYARGEETGGAFSLFEEAIDSQTGAIPHLHHEEDQAFYVLEGEHEFVCAEEVYSAPVGTYLYVPRGVVHSYQNVGATPGRLLILSTPAGGTERIFFEVGEPATDTSTPPPESAPPDMPAFREIVRRHGSDIDTMAFLRRIAAEGPNEGSDEDSSGRDVRE